MNAGEAGSGIVQMFFSAPHLSRTHLCKKEKVLHEKLVHEAAETTRSIEAGPGPDTSECCTNQ